MSQESQISLGKQFVRNLLSLGSTSRMCLGALVDVNEVTKQASLRDRFPRSRFHEHLPPQARRQMKEVGWAKGVELAKLARRDRQHFDCATWLHRAREMPKEQFKPPRQFLLDLLGTVGASKKQSATSRNSLLTGKNTEDFYFPGPNNDAPYLDITLIRIDLLSGDVEANREFSARDQGIQFPYTVGTALASDLHLAVLMRV